MINQWAAEWSIPPAAVDDLLQRLGAVFPPAQAKQGESEAAVQTRIRLEASEKGLRLWRNNVGVLFDERGVPVRYGLCNESKAMNQKMKSSDLIGIRPVLITEAHLGRTIGQFVAREVKHATWRWGEDPKREMAQLNYLTLAASLGADAAFATGEGTL